MNCVKTKYNSEAIALEDIARIKLKSTRKKIPTGTYKCKCGFWHLTSQPNWNDKIKELEERIRLLIIEKLDLVSLNFDLIKEIKEQSKKVNLKVKIDAEVINLKNQLAISLKRNKKLQNDNRDLVIQVVQSNKHENKQHHTDN